MSMLSFNALTNPSQRHTRGSPQSLPSIEIFSGAGGLALGLELAGFHHQALVEWDAHAVATLRQNSQRSAIAGHGWPAYQADVRTFDYRPFAGKVRLLAGGAPCQPFSLGGLQRGQQDHRNLFPEVFRAVRALRPEIVLLENVRNLAGRTFRPYFDYLCLQLRFPFEQVRLDEHWTDHRARLERLHDERIALGINDDEQYEVEFRTINAADYGVPQSRHRVFLIGIRRDLNTEPAFPTRAYSEDALLWSQWVDGTYWEEHSIPRSEVPELPQSTTRRVQRLIQNGQPIEHRWITLRDALAQKPQLPEPGLCETDGFQKHYLIPGARVYPGHSGNILDRPAKTIKAGDHGNPGGEHVLVRPGQIPRYLSIRECARVQTFPDSYHIVGSRSESMRQLGNAVPVLLAKQLGESVRRILERHVDSSLATRRAVAT